MPVKCTQDGGTPPQPPPENPLITKHTSFWVCVYQGPHSDSWIAVKLLGGGQSKELQPAAQLMSAKMAISAGWAQVKSARGRVGTGEHGTGHREMAGEHKVAKTHDTLEF